VIELRLIQHAMALGKARNFARAANALNLTQPSLSRSIATLERDLGVRLFDRGRTGVEPTVYGRVLLAQGQGLLGGEAELRRQLQLLAGLEAGYLVIGAGPYASATSVTTAVVRLIAAHPRLRVQVTTTSPAEIVDRVLAGQFDLGIADEGECDERRLCLQSFGPHDVRFACRPGHPLVGRRSLTLEQVLAYPLVSSLLRGDQAATVVTGGARGGVDAGTGDFTPAIYVNSIDMARRIARETDALIPGTLAMLAPDLEAGRLVIVDFHIAVMRTSYSLVYLRDRTLAPAALAFIAILREVEAELLAAAKTSPVRPSRVVRGAMPREQKKRARGG
jgi:DNA-binding transcriptional LysR family regulator